MRKFERYARTLFMGISLGVGFFIRNSFSKGPVNFYMIAFLAGLFLAALLHPPKLKQGKKTLRWIVIFDIYFIGILVLDGFLKSIFGWILVGFWLAITLFDLHQLLTFKKEKKSKLG